MMRNPVLPCLAVLASLLAGCSKPAEIHTLPAEFRGYLGSPGITQACFASDSLPDSGRVCLEYLANIEAIRQYSVKFESGEKATEESRASLSGSLNLPGMVQPASWTELGFHANGQVFAGGSETPIFFLNGWQWLLENGTMANMRPLLAEGAGLSMETRPPAPGMPEEQILVARPFSLPDGAGVPMGLNSVAVQELHLSRQYGVVLVRLVYQDDNLRRRTITLTRQL